MFFEKKKVLYSQIVKSCIMRLLSNFLILSLLVFCSCSGKQDNIVIYKEFQDNEWSRFDYLNGEFEISSPGKYDIVMEIAVNDNFPNIYEIHHEECTFSFNMTIKNPNDSGSRSKDYRYKLKDNDGNWKSDKENGYYVFKLPVISEMTLGEKGTYSFKIENKYTKDPMYGIKSLTLKCIK